MKYLAWVSGLHGPEAQVWHEKATDGNGKAKITLNPLIELDDNDVRTLDKLKQDYPYPFEAKQ